MKRCILLLIASLLCGVAVAQTPQYQVRYWFDTDLAGSVSHTLSGGTLHADIQTDALSVGVHSLHVMLLDANGQWKSLQTHLFFRIADNSEVQAARYHYWFDDDFDNHQSGNVTSGGILLDASGLSAGIHEVHIIAEDGTGRLHSPQTALFYRAPVQNMTNVPYLCWFDNDFQNRTSGTANGNITINTGSLSDGIHTVNLRIGTDENATLQSHLFYKTHTPQITKYEYWFNDQTDDDHIVVATNVEDTLTLERLIQAPAFPIRSTYFQFTPDTASSRPYVNAKNDFHFRTTNTTGRYSDRTHTYFDATVVDSVYADTLERNTTRTVRAPYNDTIRWFMVTAGVGDSLAFTASKRCTMQLFSPSGKEVMKVSEDKALKWKGLHALESGCYYLAVHDAVDTIGTLDISYSWVYKYAILHWDVHRVGNGGISSVTFIGNGFNNLDTAFLVKGIDTIPALQIARKSKTNLTIAFDFENADTGIYKAYFAYENDTLYRNQLLTVETARPILLEHTVHYSDFAYELYPAEYTYRVTNTGNMTAYTLPMHIKILSKKDNSIGKIFLDGLDLPPFVSHMDMSELTDDEKEYFLEWGASQGDAHNLFKGWDRDTVTGDSTYVRANYFAVTLAPYETKTIKVRAFSVDDVGVSITMPDSITAMRITELRRMYYRNTDQQSKLASKGDDTNSTYSCCIGGIISCSLGFVSNQASLAAAAESVIARLSMSHPQVAVVFQGAGAITATVGCISGALSTITNIVTKSLCESNPTEALDIAEYVGSISATALGCATTALGIKATSNNVKILKDLENATIGANNTLNISLETLKSIAKIDFSLSLIDVIGDIVTSASIATSQDCFSNLLNNDESGCDPNSPAGAVAAWMHAHTAYDPNDIIGYTAESGSLHIGEKQIEMPYIIEFENDTNYATAPAHRVRVVDTLYSNTYDLQSFKSTSFNIAGNHMSLDGEKSFLITVDMRPSIQVLTEVKMNYTYNDTMGIATWIFRSLDPLTLEEITDPMVGFLPPNHSGDDVGIVGFKINRKPDLPNGTIIDNRATIIFDNNDPISTPTWRNIVDNTPPVSNVADVLVVGDTVKVSMTATDNLSGVWRYNVYGMRDSTWYTMALNVPADSAAKFYANVEYDGFRTAAIDSAGNIEQVLPPAPTVNKEETLTGCDSIVWRDSIYTATGDYTRTFEGQRTGDADTVVTLHLTVYNVEHTATVDTACDSYTWNGTVYTQSGLYTFSHDDANGCTQVDTLHLVVFNGFQINVAAGTWNAIASPVLSNGSTESVEWVENLIDGTYDLFRYNEAEGKWENYKSHHFDLERGRGYIYRRSDAQTLKFKGIPNNGNFSGHSVTRSCADATLKGFNLVGNPYPHAIRKGQAFATTSDTLVTGWYELRPNGIWYAHTDADPIAIGQAVLVKTKDNLNGATGLRFSDITPGGKGSYLSSPTISFTVSGNGVSDIAYAILAEGSSLPKFGHLAEEAPMLSIPVENGSYAIASLGANCKQFDLAFRGRPGNYTISLHDIQAGVAYSSEPRNGSEQPSYFDYVHLIDLATGLDIDLLSQPDYNFTHTDGQTPANRFLVKLWPDSAAPSKSPFAYQSGNNIVVCGQGTLFVYDILGRQLFSKEMTAFNSQIPASTFPYTGVYVLRLGEQTQKIVVRQ